MFSDVKISDVLVWCIAFLQLASLPLMVIGAQNLVKGVLGRNFIVLDVTIAISVCASVLLIPLGLFDLLPLGVYQRGYGIAAMVGGIVAVPLTKFVRGWRITRDYFQ